MEKKKTSGLFVLVVFELILLVLILISSLYQQGLNKELHAMIEEGKPSSTTETVLPLLPHFYDNCGLFRLGIEAVYRIPLEEADNYSYGYLNGMVVEPFQQDCNKKNLQVNVGGYEHDFYYAYDYSDVIQLEDYRDDDGYLYCHVYGQKVMGKEGGAANWIWNISGLLVFLGPPFLAIMLLATILIYFINKAKAIAGRRKQPA